MKKTTLFMILALVLSMAIGLTGTLAYLTDTDEDVNVMTLGSVYITQNEQEYNDKGELVPFTQDKPLYPAVGTPAWNIDKNDPNTTEEEKAWRQFAGLENVVDKYVTVTNTGKSDAYVRTLIAFEAGSLDMNELAKVLKPSTNDIAGSEFSFPGTWDVKFDEMVDLNGNIYNVMVFEHQNAVKPGETTIPSLLQLYLAGEATTNETMEAIDGNANGKYDVLVLSQAVQTEGFKDATDALTAGFGELNAANIAEWFKNIGSDIGTPGKDWPNNNPPIPMPATNWLDEGNADTSWYDAAETEFEIGTAAELAGLAKLVYSGNNLSGKTVKLTADIDLGDNMWTPIGRMINTSGTNENSTFKGNFDGQNHTVKNLFIDTVDGVIDTNRGAGFFGALTGNVENLNIDTAIIKTAHWAGAIAGSIEGSIKNCNVSGVQITCLTEKVGNEWDNGDKAGAIVGYATHGTIENCTVSGATITAYRDLGGIVGASYNSVKNCSIEDVTLIQDNTNNYKNYTQDKTDVNDIVGEKYGSCTVEDCTGTADISYTNWD